MKRRTRRRITKALPWIILALIVAFGAVAASLVAMEYMTLPHEPES